VPIRGADVSLSDLKGPSGDLDFVGFTPTRDETARVRRIEEIDRDRIVDDAAHARWRHRPPVGAAILVEPSPRREPRSR
jgi:hypothetical protein